MGWPFRSHPSIEEVHDALLAGKEASLAQHWLAFAPATTGRCCARTPRTCASDSPVQLLGDRSSGQGRAREVAPAVRRQRDPDLSGRGRRRKVPPGTRPCACVARTTSTDSPDGERRLREPLRDLGTHVMGPAKEYEVYEDTEKGARRSTRIWRRASSAPIRSRPLNRPPVGAANAEARVLRCERLQPRRRPAPRCNDAQCPRSPR